ncbi:HEXXH motif-containing putative peptide modification protein [Streptomyces triculaminicus]|uniref:aKG-HExxH-type peptide beta-hydroxylase n=1 Tax=Streptomyces triculaminicus TaxID=2816232 RepID=UPI0033DD4AFF
MTVERLPPGALARLARTRSAPGDHTALRDGAHSLRLVLLKSLLTRLERHPGAVPRPARERFEEHWRLLERTEARDRRPVRDTLDYPSVGHWLARTLAAPDGDALAGALGHFGAVVASAALRASGSFTLETATPGGVLVLPGAGLAETGTDTVRLTAHGRTARLTAAGRRTGPVLLRVPGRVCGVGPGWRALSALPGSDALVDDLDPYRAPPEGVSRAALPPAPRSETGREPWARHWRAALDLLRATDAERAAEVTALLRCLVPLARSGPYGRAVTRVSATYRVAPGAVLTSAPGTAEDLAEVLVHETQHGKLAVLHDLLPLHRAAPEAVHRVAWRTDPRPLAGVLQGTYAHLALADFWARAAAGRTGTPSARREARARRDSYLRQVAQALPILLESGELTPAGREFTQGMERHLADLGRLRDPSATIGGTSPAGDVR